MTYYAIHSWNSLMDEQDTIQLNDLKEAIAAFSYCARLANTPEEYRDITKHPDWVKFNRFDVNNLGVGDKTDPKTLVILRRCNG